VAGRGVTAKFLIQRLDCGLGTLRRHEKRADSTSVIDVPFGIRQWDGVLRPQSELMDILAGLDCRRIRRCLICGKLFWAGRITKVCCTEEWSRVQRAREWRKAHPGI